MPEVGASTLFENTLELRVIVKTIFRRRCQKSKVSTSPSTESTLSCSWFVYKILGRCARFI